jgi:hypothetical protein
MKTKPKKRKATKPAVPPPPITKLARGVSLTIGAAIGSLGAIGAYQLQAGIDGPTSYLALAAPVVSLSALPLPYFAECAWKAKQYLKSALLWAAVIPAAAVAFYGAAERVHQTKAVAEAGRTAAHATAARAESDLRDAKANAKAAIAAADKVRGLDAKTCGPKCLSIKASETAARARVTEADAAVQAAQAHATTEANLKAPVWLLPAGMDFAAFMLVWFGLGGSKKEERKKPAKKTSRGKRKTKTNKAAKPSGAVIKLHAVG